MKIKTRLTILFLLLMLAPILIIGFIGYFNAKKIIENQEFSVLESIITSKTTEVNHLLQLRLEQSTQLAGTFRIRQMESSGVNNPKVVANIQAHIVSILNEIKLADGKNNSINKISAIDIIGVWDIEGVIVANTNTALIGKKMPPHYLQNVKENNFYFAGFETDSLTGKKLLIFLKSIRNYRDNKFAGAVMLKVEAKILNDITTNRIGLGETGEILLGKKYGDTLEFITQLRHAQTSPMITIGSNLALPMQNAIQGKNGSTITYDYLGNEVLAVYNHILDLNWGIVAKINIDEAYVPIYELRNILVILGLVLLILTTFIAIWVARTFTIPITQAVKVANKVAHGDLSTVINNKGAEEIKELGTALRKMQKNILISKNQVESKQKELVALNESLEHKVTLRTAELNGLNRTLEQKEKYSSTILNNALDGFIVIDKKGIIESFNKAASLIFGYAEQEVIGKNVSMLANEHDRKQHDQYLSNYNKTRKPQIIGKGREVIGARKDGELFPMRLGIAEVLLNDRVVFIGTVQDLTKEKASERLIIEAQEKYESTFNQAPISIVNMDLNYRFIKTNAAFSNLFGFSEKELLTMGIEDLTIPSDIKETKKKFELLQKGSLKILLEKQCIKRNKEKIWVEVSISPLKDKEDTLIAYIATLEDISLRIQTEQELQNQSKELNNVNTTLIKSKRAAFSMMQDANMQKERAEKILSQLEVSSYELKKLNLAIEQSFITIVITDNKGKIEYVNPAFTKSSGYTFEEVSGKKLYTLKNTKHTNKIYEEVWQSLLEGKTWKGDVVHMKKTGEEYWESVSISPIYNNNNEITHFVAVKEDISERKQLEEALIKSRDQANKANEAKSSFLANMSHEIRTPMNAILGFSEIMSKQVENQSHLDYLKSIQSSGKTLLTLINDILDLSKIESGKFNFSLESINIEQLINDIINMLKIKAKEKGLQLNFTISNNLPRVLFIDELRIKQILINLINNAIKFTEQGYVEVEITSKNSTKDSIDLILKVKDTGIGIPQAYHEKIFQAFDQMDMQDNKKYGGTGLGLAITQELIKLMNGDITLKSEEGKGSTFTVVLKNIIYSKDKNQVEKKIELELDTIQFKNATVLIVDDIEANRYLLRAYMQNYDINTIEAENGKEALEAIKKYIPDLVFLDLRMPVMDGFETIEVITKNPDWSHIPIVAITASVFNKDEQNLIEKGFCGYVTKPANSIDIVTVLKKHIEHSVVIKAEDTIIKTKFQPIDNLEELMLEIEKNITPLWNNIKNIRKKKEVLLLVSQLLEIGEKYNATVVVDYGKELQLACESFNITKEKKLLQKLPQFIKNLNSQRNER